MRGEIKGEEKDFSEKKNKTHRFEARNKSNRQKKTGDKMKGKTIFNFTKKNQE